MMRIIPFTTEEILIDPVAVGKALDAAVRRRADLRFSGLCALGTEILVGFEESEPGSGAPSDRGATFRLEELPSRNRDQVVAAMQERWTGGETTLAVFPVADKTWGLFRKEPE